MWQYYCGSSSSSRYYDEMNESVHGLSEFADGYDSGVEPFARHRASQLVCAHCGKKKMGLKNCSRSRALKYCSTNCQKLHWTSKHRNECLSWKEMVQE